MKQLLLNSIVILFLSKGIALKTNSHHKLKLGLRETLVLNKILENKKNQNSTIFIATEFVMVDMIT